MTNASTTSQTLPTGTWNLDPARSVTTVTVKKLGFITVSATLALVEGAITVDASGAVSDVHVTMSAASYTSGNDKRDEHVRASDFLDAETYPHLTFAASDVVPTSSGYAATGTVTVKGQTAPLAFAINTVSVDEATGTFDAVGSIERSAIGINKMPTLVIGKELQLAVSAHAAIAGG